MITYYSYIVLVLKYIHKFFDTPTLWGGNYAPLLYSGPVIVHFFLTSRTLWRWCVVCHFRTGQKKLCSFFLMFLLLVLWRLLFRHTLSESSHHALRNAHHIKRSCIGVPVNRSSPDARMWVKKPSWKKISQLQMFKATAIPKSFQMKLQTLWSKEHLSSLCPFLTPEPQKPWV